MTMRATQKKMMSKPVTSTVEGGQIRQSVRDVARHTDERSGHECCPSSDGDDVAPGRSETKADLGAEIAGADEERVSSHATSLPAGDRSVEEPSIRRRLGRASCWRIP